MTTLTQNQRLSTGRDYLRILRRRAPLIIAVALVVPAVAYFTSRSQDPLYEARAQVLLSRQNLPSLVGVDLMGYEEPERAAQTQASVARSPRVAEAALEAAGLDSRSPGTLLGTSSVSADPNTDLLFFTVRNRDPDAAARLATAYANAYIGYRRELDTLPIRSAKQKLQAKINDLEARGRTNTSLYNSLLAQEQKLEEVEALLTSNASLLREADFGSQIRPRPTRNAILGLILGLALGLVLALLAEAIDTRVRSIDELTERLRIPLLGRIPRLKRRYHRGGEEAMVVASESIEAEAFRMLRTNLDFVNLDRRARTIMITSATQEEGKSTTAVNLALAFARANRRVALVDLDLRRPSIARFFELSDLAFGVSNVALGEVDLEAALVHIPLAESARDLSALRDGGQKGELLVLPSGPSPPEPGEFVGSNVVQGILGSVRSMVDLVLIDAPPILHVGDALTLSAKVDAIVLVTRLRMLNRSMLNDLARALETSPAEALGIVVTDAHGPDPYGSLYHRQAHNGKPARRRTIDRERQLT